MSDRGTKRLGRRVRAERMQRWPRRVDFAHACGLSKRLIAAVEVGERANFSDATIDAIEYTLGWEPGTAARIRAGLPEPASDPEFARLRSLWPRLSRDARRMIVAAAEQSVKD